MFDYNYCQAPLQPQDEDLTNFLSATGIEDKDQIFALNYLITELKANNLWEKMQVVYPFVGGTTHKHSFNLKDPTQNKIDWYGGVTHDETGITGNGLDGYGNSNYVIPSENQDSLHLSVYCRNNIDSGMAIGVTTLTSSTLIIPSASNTYVGRVNQVGGGEITNGNTLNSNSYFLSSRTNNLAVNNYENTTLFFSENSVSTLPSTLPLFILARNLNGVDDYFSNLNISIVTIGEGLTDDESKNLYQTIHNFQKYLNRNI